MWEFEHYLLFCVSDTVEMTQTGFIVTHYITQYNSIFYQIDVCLYLSYKSYSETIFLLLLFVLTFRPFNDIIYNNNEYKELATSFAFVSTEEQLGPLP